MTTITVIGSDSLLGAAVAKALVKDSKVQAIPLLSDAYSNSIRSAGVDVRNVDPGSVPALIEALQGSHGCFINTLSDLSNQAGHAQEVQHGKNIAEACAQAGVRHVVYSTQLTVVKMLGLRAAHMDAKAEIEGILKLKNLPLTCIVVPLMFQQLLIPPFRPRRVDHYTFGLEIPMGQAPLDMINADDVGGVVSNIFHQGSAHAYKTLSLSGDKLTVREMAALLSAYLAPRVFRDTQITVEQYIRMPFAGAQDYGYMFDFYTRVDQRASMDLTKRLNPATVNFELWLAENCQAVAQAMDYSTTPPSNPWA